MKYRGYTRDFNLSLQFTQVLMFPVNTIIAWYVNIYHKCEDMIITTLLLPLGHISNSLPLAIVYIQHWKAIGVEYTKV